MSSISNASNSPSKKSGTHSYYGDSPTRGRGTPKQSMTVEKFRPLSHPDARTQLSRQGDGFGTSSYGIIRTARADEEV